MQAMNRKNKIYISATKLLLAYLLFTTAYLSYAENIAESALNGTWVQVSGTVNGQPQPKNVVESSYISFSGTKFHYSSAGEVNSGITQVNGTQTSGSIDLVFNEGKAIGRTTYALYEIKDNLLFVSILKEKISGSSIPKVGACNCSGDMQFRRQASSVLVAHNDPVLANDLFIGKFSSETRENFGPGKLGEVEVNIDRKGEKYIITVFHQGEFKYDYLAEICSPEKEGYLEERPPGNAYALCGSPRGGGFVYSQNGIKDPLAKIYRLQGIENPEKDKYYRTQYYGNIQWSFWGFRKVDSFQFAPNDPLILSNRETPEFINLCKTAGVKLLEKPVAPVRSIAYDWDPQRLKGRPHVDRFELDGDGRIGVIGGFSERNSVEAQKKNIFEFTEIRRDSYRSGAASQNPSAPYYRFTDLSTKQPYYGVDNLSADVLAYLDVDNPDELRKAPIKQGVIRYQLTLSDRRSGAILGVQTFVVDRINNRACGANVGNNISQNAFIYDAINR